MFEPLKGTKVTILHKLQANVKCLSMGFTYGKTACYPNRREYILFRCRRHTKCNTPES